jgi:hypothetical protein
MAMLVYQGGKKDRTGWIRSVVFRGLDQPNANGMIFPRSNIWIPGVGNPYVYGASEEMVREHAFFLWENDEEPRRESSYYWGVAQTEMVHPLALELAKETGLIFKPGSTFWPYHYYREDYDWQIIQARIGNVHPDEDIWVMEYTNSMTLVTSFDLTHANSIDKIIDTMKEWRDQPLPDDKVSIQPDDVIIAAMMAGGMKHSVGCSGK